MSEHLERIEEFTAAVKTQKCCFILSSDNGLLITESQFQTARDVLLFWSDKEAAKQQAKDEWQNFNLIELDFEDTTDLLSHLSDDDMLVGIELTDEQTAIEIEASALLTQLTE